MVAPNVTTFYIEESIDANHHTSRVLVQNNVNELCYDQINYYCLCSAFNLASNSALCNDGSGGSLPQLCPDNAVCRRGKYQCNRGYFDSFYDNGRNSLNCDSCLLLKECLKIDAATEVNTIGLQNPDFENGLKSWMYTANAYVVEYACYFRTKCVMLVIKSDSTKGLLYQSFLATGGVNQLTFFYKMSTQPYNTPYISAILTDNTAGNSITILNRISGTFDWRPATAFIVSDHVYTLSINCDGSGVNYGVTSACFFDHVTTRTIPDMSVIQNPEFDDDLDYWDCNINVASVSVVTSTTECYYGNKCISIRGKDISIFQSFFATESDNLLIFYYKISTDLSYDFMPAILTDNTAGTSVTITNNILDTTDWRQATAWVVSGHLYTLSLNTYDNNFDGIFFFDHVSLITVKDIRNPDFTNDLDYWTYNEKREGVDIVTTGCYYGNKCVSVSNKGFISIYQSFLVTGNVNLLTFYYKMSSTDCSSVEAKNHMSAVITDNTAAMSVTILTDYCGTFDWRQASVTVISGHLYTLSLSCFNLDNDPTSTCFYDHINLQNVSDNRIKNPDFENGLIYWNYEYNSKAGVNLGTSGCFINGTKCVSLGVSAGLISISQTFKATEKGLLSLYYKMSSSNCLNDYMSAILTDNNVGTSVMILDSNCGTFDWRQAIAFTTVVSGHVYTLSLNCYRSFAYSSTICSYDHILIPYVPHNGIQNSDFDNDLTYWSYNTDLVERIQLLSSNCYNGHGKCVSLYSPPGNNRVTQIYQLFVATESESVLNLLLFYYKMSSNCYWWWDNRGAHMSVVLTDNTAGTTDTLSVYCGSFDWIAKAVSVVSGHLYTLSLNCDSTSVASTCFFDHFSFPIFPDYGIQNPDFDDDLAYWNSSSNAVVGWVLI